MLGIVGNLSGGKWVIVLLGLLIIFFYFLAIFEIISSKKMSGTDKALWILVLFFLSGIGMIAYYAFGRKNR